MITCIKCDKDKVETDFYTSTLRKNGTGECKDCVKDRANARRWANIEKAREYDRKRGSLPHRVKARKEYAKTERGKAALRRSSKAYEIRYPYRAQATDAVNNAVRDGKLHKPNECEECGKVCRPQGHHCDYNKQLDVMWLCVDCHVKWHKNNTPIYHVNEL